MNPCGDPGCEECRPSFAEQVAEFVAAMRELYEAVEPWLKHHPFPLPIDGHAYRRRTRARRRRR
jgi:hypothetical protein